MIALLFFFVTLLGPPFKSKSRLQAENAVLRRQLIILRRQRRGRVRLTNWDRLFLVQLYLISIGAEDHLDHPARDPRALAPGRLPAILAVEIPLPWRPAASRCGAARADPADER